MRGFVLAALLAAGPALAYDGLYVPEGATDWDCQSVGQMGGALAVQDDKLFGVENTCALTNPVPVRGMDATLFDAECSGEGMTSSERVLLMSSPEGLIVLRNGFAVLWTRC